VTDPAPKAAPFRTLAQAAPAKPDPGLVMPTGPVSDEDRLRAELEKGILFTTLQTALHLMTQPPTTDQRPARMWALMRWNSAGPPGTMEKSFRIPLFSNSLRRRAVEFQIRR